MDEGRLGKDGEGMKILVGILLALLIGSWIYNRWYVYNALSECGQAYEERLQKELQEWQYFDVIQCPYCGKEFRPSSTKGAKP